MICVCIEVRMHCMTLKHENWDSKVEKFQVSESSGFKGNPKRDDINVIKLNHLLKAHVTHFPCGLTY